MDTRLDKAFVILRPLQLSLRRAMSEIVDRHLGLVTTDEHVAKHIGVDIGTFRRTWRAMGWTSCWRLLSQLPAGKNDVFLDIGCGAGRMACAAARHGFARVIGVEIDPAFARLASDNAAKLRAPHSPCDIVQEDATRYTVPDDVTVVFLYNPFAGSVLDEAIERVIESYQRRPRRITVAYANPVEHDRLASNGRLVPLRRMHLSWRPDRDWLRTQAVQFYELLVSEPKVTRVRGLEHSSLQRTPF